MPRGTRSCAHPPAPAAPPTTTRAARPRPPGRGLSSSRAAHRPQRRRTPARGRAPLRRAAAPAAARSGRATPFPSPPPSHRRARAPRPAPRRSGWAARGPRGRRAWRCAWPPSAGSRPRWLRPSCGGERPTSWEADEQEDVSGSILDLFDPDLSHCRPKSREHPPPQVRYPIGEPAVYVSGHRHCGRG